ncbi:MAG: sigma-54-dependent Fis family transcriptional regulator [Pirellulales bacterium]|nr:sigma-54-dependent Fis family transcriptional regulator [Pirellulales bacterium]
MSVKSEIVVFDERAASRHRAARSLRDRGHEVTCFDSPQKALDHIKKSTGLVVGRVHASRSGDLELFRETGNEPQGPPFLIVIEADGVGSVLQVRKLGRLDLGEHGIATRDLAWLADECARRESVQNRAGGDSSKALCCGRTGPIVGESSAIRNVLDRMVRAARSDSTVLITGESGVGKELVAKAVHQNSPRCRGPFVAVNMAAVAESLIESELFGHISGAFTGATTGRKGRFEAAHRGTLFIDEIGDLRPDCQAKLLRVLENRTVNPVGSNEEIEVDVRVVAATSRNLQEMVDQGQFRKELMYRLKVVEIEVPPLRKRRGDIPLLVGHFLQELCQRNNRTMLQLEPELLQLLKQCPWPGNVRQLRNCIESMVVMARDKRLTLAELPPWIQLELPGKEEEFEIPRNLTLDDLERLAVSQALKRCRGIRTRAAKALGISPRTLHRKLRQWRIDERPPLRKERPPALP